MHAIVLEQGARGHGDVPSYEGRDVSMAENVRSLLEIEGPAAKAVLWAHNGHAARESRVLHQRQRRRSPTWAAGCISSSAAITSSSALRSTRVHSRQSRRKRGLVNHSVPPAPEGSLDATLAKAAHRRPGMPAFLLDLKTAPASGRSPTGSPRSRRRAGSAPRIPPSAPTTSCTAATRAGNSTCWPSSRSTTAARPNRLGTADAGR